MITNAGNVSIRTLRRRSILGRTLLACVMTLVEVRLVAINALRRGELTVSRRLLVLSLRLTRACLCLCGLM